MFASSHPYPQEFLCGIPLEEIDGIAEGIIVEVEHEAPDEIRALYMEVPPHLLLERGIPGAPIPHGNHAFLCIAQVAVENALLDIIRERAEIFLRHAVTALGHRERNV